MRNSDELYEVATKSVQAATGCTEQQAKKMVSDIAAYFARFSAEITTRSGPAHDYAKSQGI